MRHEIHDKSCLGCGVVISRRRASRSGACLDCQRIRRNAERRRAKVCAVMARQAGAVLLSEATDEVALRQAVDVLWSLLDDIDTLSDSIKPRDEAGYRRFYDRTMAKVALRHKHVRTDGWVLFLRKEEA